MPTNPTETSVAGMPIDDLAPLTGDNSASFVPPTPIVKPQAPAKTVATPTEIDWSTIDPSLIPDSVIKASKLGQTLMTETVERRQAIKLLKEQIGAVDGVKPDAKPAKPEDDNTPDWAKKLMGEFENIKAISTSNGRKALVDEALTSNNLPAEAATWITATDAVGIKAQAAELAKTFLTPNAGGSSAGGGQPVTAHDRAKAAIQAAVTKSMTPINPIESSFFNPSIQDRIG